MTHDTEERIGLLMHRATDDVASDDALIHGAMRTGDRRRRLRSAGYGGAALATVAVLATTWVALQPNRAEQTPVATPGAPSSAADQSPAPPESRLPTPAELSAQLAAALDGPSTEVRTEVSETEPHQIRAERLFNGGSVEINVGEIAAFVAVGIEDPEALLDDYVADRKRHCKTGKSWDGINQGCSVNDDGSLVEWWVTTPDVEGAKKAGARQVYLEYFTSDGNMVRAWVGNGPGPSAPAVTDEPVLSPQEVVELATTTDWFPTT